MFIVYGILINRTKQVLNYLYYYIIHISYTLFLKSDMFYWLALASKTTLSPVILPQN